MIASPTTLALIAVAEADDPLAQIGIDIFNPQGLLLTTSAPALGGGGGQRKPLFTRCDDTVHLTTRVRL